MLGKDELEEWRAALVVCERHSTHNSALVQAYVERVRKLERETRELRTILDEVLEWIAGRMAEGQL